MLLSQLIQELTEALREHGDVEVFTEVDHYKGSGSYDLIEPTVMKINEGMVVR